jgi:glutamyl-tRNA reductase
MDAVTKRFPLANTLKFYSIPSNSIKNIKQMEDKSVLVFGCGELSIQLTKSLVLMRVKLVTVICLAEEQARKVRKLTDALGGNSTKIVIELIDPSKQVCNCKNS